MRVRTDTRIVGLLIAPFVLAGCAQPAATATEAPAPTAGLATQPPSPTAPGASATAPSPVDTIHLVLAPEGSLARYRVREQLASLSFPSDAVGETTEVTGEITITALGQVVPEVSTFTVNLDSLQSDRDLRDGFVRRNTLQTDLFPLATFTAREARGLASPLPTSGPVAFQLLGDLTLHGVTQESLWEVSGVVDGDNLTGTASTQFTFNAFGLEIPRVLSVLSVDDLIRLELDFNLMRVP